MARHTRKQLIWRRRIFVSFCVLVIAGIIIGAGFGIKTLIKHGENPTDNKKGQTVTETKDGKTEENPTLVSSVTVINTGDIMVHSTQLDGAKSDDGYDFSAFFKHIKNNVSAADLAIANLEVTFGGSESGAYSGYPAFNTPDCLADCIKDAGFDLLLTVNNHCYDTGIFGLKRTLDVLKEKNLSYVGTRKDTSENLYTVKKVNGIKLGITAYGYENKCDTAGRKSLNGNIISAEANDLVNTFNYDRINEFYENAEDTISKMKEKGADKIVFYMHWGEEYQLSENTHQKAIAQKLCDLGVDIIIGSHPHVVQPVELLTSSGGDRKTICCYSMGNAISNQRQEIMHPECTTGHTEDGMLISYTIDKYSDGSTKIRSFDITPTWVDKYKGGSGYQYSIYPLSSSNSGAGFGLTGTALSKSRRSYSRTMDIIGAGLNEVKNYLKAGLN